MDLGGKMRKMLACVVILLCVATVRNHPQRRYHASSKIFWKYMRTFERVYSEFGVDLQNQRVYMGIPLGRNDILGYCHRNRNNAVEIHFELWDHLSEEGKELLIFHEFGHCVLNLEHTFGTLGSRNWKSPYNCPTTIMQAGHRMFYDECYSKYKKFYWQGLGILKSTRRSHGEL